MKTSAPQGHVRSGRENGRTTGPKPVDIWFTLLLLLLMLLLLLNRAVSILLHTQRERGTSLHLRAYCIVVVDTNT